MPHFHHKREGYFLSTNHKVMYSTLVAEDGLCRPHPLRLLRHALLQQLLPGRAAKHYLLVRNPYDRLESFYRNKFHRTEDVRQDCIQLFYGALGLDAEDATGRIRERLRSVSFGEFISLLPEVYDKDPHLAPQHGVRDLFRIGPFGLNLQFDEVIKIDGHRNDERLRKELKLTLDRFHNVTGDMEVQTDWSRESLEIVRDLYQKDFEKYHYRIRHAAAHQQ